MDNIILRGLQPPKILNIRFSALIRMYAKCGSVEDAAEVFDSMKERELRDLIT